MFGRLLCLFGRHRWSRRMHLYWSRNGDYTIRRCLRCGRVQLAFARYVPPDALRAPEATPD